MINGGFRTGHPLKGLADIGGKNLLYRLQLNSNNKLSLFQLLNVLFL